MKESRENEPKVEFSQRIIATISEWRKQKIDQKSASFRGRKAEKTAWFFSAFTYDTHVLKIVLCLNFWSFSSENHRISRSVWFESSGQEYCLLYSFSDGMISHSHGESLKKGSTCSGFSRLFLWFAECSILHGFIEKPGAGSWSEVVSWWSSVGGFW